MKRTLKTLPRNQRTHHQLAELAVNWLTAVRKSASCLSEQTSIIWRTFEQTLHRDYPCCPRLRIGEALGASIVRADGAHSGAQGWIHGVAAAATATDPNRHQYQVKVFAVFSTHHHPLMLGLGCGFAGCGFGGGLGWGFGWPPPLPPPARG